MVVETHHTLLAPSSFSLEEGGPLLRCVWFTGWAQIWCLGDQLYARSPSSILLSTEEREKANRYRFHRDRSAFIVRRTALRILLGRNLQIEPEALCFSQNAFGKPSLAWPKQAELAFSVSHTAGFVLLAIGTCEAIGVDVERVRYNLDFLALGRNVFTECELAWLTSADGQLAMADRFFRLWTAKEACLKAIGTGFGHDPRSYDPTIVALKCDTLGSSGRCLTYQGCKSLEVRLGDSLRSAFAWADNSYSLAPR